MSDNRKRIMDYKEAHPEATVRGIQKALGLSSTSIVQHHLRMGRYAGKPYHDIVRENEELRARNKYLEAKLVKIWAAAQPDKGAK